VTDSSIRILLDEDAELRIPLKTYADKGERAIRRVPSSVMLTSERPQGHLKVPQPTVREIVNGHIDAEGAAG
jgi:hypothetical protein